MFDPTWDEGCKSCSFWIDNLDGVSVHLNHRDVTFVAISCAPYATLEAYRKRMGWRVKWLSSFRTDFNRDYHVTFTPEERESGRAYYKYATGRRRGDLEKGATRRGSPTRWSGWSVTTPTSRHRS